MDPEQEEDLEWLERHLSTLRGGDLQTAYSHANAWAKATMHIDMPIVSTTRWERRLALVKARALIENITLET